jgi:hypothetical protein
VVRVRHLIAARRAHHATTPWRRVAIHSSSCSRS